MAVLRDRDVLTPDTLALLQLVADTGSFAAAARHLGLVPSALTYRIRQVEDALDVLLFDRSARQARPTEAGLELLREGARLLRDVDAVANRVRRVATGWEPELRIAVDGVVSRTTLFELVEAFYAIAPPTRLKIIDSILAGTLETLTTGRADLAIGVAVDASNVAGLQQLDLGEITFRYVVAPHHPLADEMQPVSDDILRQHRIIAVADSSRAGQGQTRGVLSGQDVLTVDTMQAKLQAQLRGIGGGFLPDNMTMPYLHSGQLVERELMRPPRKIRLRYAWNNTAPGKALQWWLDQLLSAATRESLLNNHYVG